VLFSTLLLENVFQVSNHIRLKMPRGTILLVFQIRFTATFVVFQLPNTVIYAMTSLGFRHEYSFSLILIFLIP